MFFRKSCASAPTGDVYYVAKYTHAWWRENRIRTVEAKQPNPAQGK
jgi:hypothetical protein